MAMLEIRDLNVYYGGIHALKGISLEVEEGQIVSMIGSNGAGKSSMMNAISGIVKYKSGEILYKGQPLPTAPTAAPNIMELTTHSWVWAEIWNSLAIKGKAPAITPISRPNSRPASAARKQTKNVIVLFERPCFLLSGITPSS